MILLGYSTSLGYGLLCLLLSWILYKKGVPKKFTRKTVHILVGFEWVILNYFFGPGIHFTVVCLLFLALLVLEYRMKMFPMISSEADNSPGTMYYAVAMTGVSVVGIFVPEIMLPFGIGVLCTSLGDGFAGLVGQLIKKGNPKIYKGKSLYGTLANFVVSSLFAYVFSCLYEAGLTLWQCMIIGVLSTELELVTGWGLDNITVTWGTAALAYALMYFDGINEYLIPILISPLIIIFSNLKSALTKGGILTAILLDIVVTLAFGTFGFVVMCTFFLGSGIIDKFKKYVKNKGRNIYTGNDHARNYMQVLANGMVSGISALAFLITGRQVFIVPFVAGLAEAFADTASSGIGVLSTHTFDICRWKKCPKGLSGGVSFIGTLSSLIAAVLLSLVALAFGKFGFDSYKFTVVACAAFVGGIIDSILGSLLQVKYRCTSCGCITEDEIHCSLPTEKYSGLSAVDNDIVNFISCASSAIIATVIVLI